jgi:hypothetical protein
VPVVRSSLVFANERSKWRMSPPLAIAVISWITTSGSVRLTASSTAFSSRPSTITGSAPSARISTVAGSERTAPITSCPAATSCGTSRLPIAPFAPAT